MEYVVKNANKPTNSILFFESTGCSLFIRDGQFIVSGANSQEHAERLLTAHNPIDTYAIREVAKAALLVKLGINADEAKLLLS